MHQLQYDTDKGLYLSWPYKNAAVRINLTAAIFFADYK